jgi:Mn-dependent DtxR family transcriptional regulator
MAEVAGGKIIGTDKRLTDFDRSLLWVMTSYLTFGSWMKVQQSQLAEDMGSSASQISRSVKRLVDAGVIERRGSHKYKLNPMVGTMGSRRKARVDNAKAKGWQTIDGDGS